MGQSEPEDKGVCLRGRAYGQIYTHQVKAPLAKKCSTNRLRKSLLLAKTWSCTQIVFHHVVRAAIWLKGCPQKCRDCEVPNLDSVCFFLFVFFPGLSPLGPRLSMRLCWIPVWERMWGHRNAYVRTLRLSVCVCLTEWGCGKRLWKEFREMIGFPSQAFDQMYYIPRSSFRCGRQHF